MRVRFYNIVWDTDPPPDEEILPQEVFLDMPDDTDVDERGEDFLAAEYDYRGISYNYEILPK